jgi:hypothetical protein
MTTPIKRLKFGLEAVDAQIFEEGFLKQRMANIYLLRGKAGSDPPPIALDIGGGELSLLGMLTHGRMSWFNLLEGMPFLGRDKVIQPSQLEHLIPLHGPFEPSFKSDKKTESVEGVRAKPLSDWNSDDYVLHFADAGVKRLAKGLHEFQQAFKSNGLRVFLLAAFRGNALFEVFIAYFVERDVPEELARWFMIVARDLVDRVAKDLPHVLAAFTTDELLCMVWIIARWEMKPPQDMMHQGAAERVNELVKVNIFSSRHTLILTRMHIHTHLVPS